MIRVWKTSRGVALALGLLILGSSASYADLVIAVPNWFSGQASANIIKVALKKEFGIEADAVEMGTLTAFAGLDSGMCLMVSLLFAGIKISSFTGRLDAKVADPGR